jgi:hypothetical protein
MRGYGRGPARLAEPVTSGSCFAQAVFQNHSGQASTGDGAGDGRAPRAPVRADGTPSDPNHPVERRPAHREGTIIATLHLIDRRDETILSTKV